MICPPQATAAGPARLNRVVVRCQWQGHRPAWAGETRVAFPDPATKGESTITAAMAKAIALATASRCLKRAGGPKAPRSAPAPPWRALLARRVGRWPALFPDLPVYRGPSRTGGGNAVRFLVPPGEAGVLSPPQWQRPSPLPQRSIAACPAGGPKAPRPAPAPPLAGASRPPGRALACVVPGPAGLQGTVPHGRGKRGAFPCPARRGERPAPDAMAKAIAFATVPG